MCRTAGWSLVLGFLVLGAAHAAGGPQSLASLAQSGNWQEIEKRGPSVLPELIALYEASDDAARANIARVFYGLGWKSEEAKRALLRDVHTKDRDLRLQVQWAL